MPKAALEFQAVTFIYPSAATPVFEDLDLRLPRGWTGVIGPNGAGKTTLLRLALGELTPNAGRVLAPRMLTYCAQQVDMPPAGLLAFLDAPDHRARSLQGQLGVADDWPQRWATLSHGEQKRAQIAVALWAEPDVLALDEPTNHIDADARRQLEQALRTFRGVGLLVSHDRDLLDALCNQCLMVSPGRVAVRPGGYSKATELAEAEAEQLRGEREHARREMKRLKRESVKRRDEASRSHARRSKRGLAIKDHDARFRINQARVSGKDSQAGRLYNQLQGRVQHAADRVNAIDAPATQRLGIKLTGECSRRDTLLRLPAQRIPLWHRLSNGDFEERQSNTPAAQGVERPENRGRPSPSNEPRTSVRAVPASEQAARNPGQSSREQRPRDIHERMLTIPDLEILPDARIALTGPNGSGKSTLLRHIMAQLTLPPERVIYLPQELPAAAADAALRDLHALRSDAYGEMISTVTRLGSDPQRVMNTARPSPGELRKILLARGLTLRPHLIVMDEPTNHLDLPSIECLEGALSDVECALLLVSHDQRFLESLTRQRWRIMFGEGGSLLEPGPVGKSA